MRQAEERTIGSQRPGERANTRLILPVVLCFGLGLGVSAYWFSRKPRPAAPEPAEQAAPALSESTMATLKRLRSPIELRLYSLFDPATAPEPLRAYAARVDKFLADYQQASGGRIKVVRILTNSYAAATAAVADGIKPVGGDQGESFLGVAVVSGDHKESLAQLSPDWEPALEADLTRAVVRVQEANNSAAAQVVPSPVQVAATQQVQDLIPNLANVSLEDGSRMLREAALKEFQAAAQEMQARVQEAQQQLVAAQSSNSESEQQAAMKRLQQIQADQTQKLQEIAAKSKAQIEALKQLKAAGK